MNTDSHISRLVGVEALKGGDGGRALRAVLCFAPYPVMSPGVSSMEFFLENMVLSS